MVNTSGLESGWHLAAGQLLLLLGNYSLKLQSSSDTISIQFLQLRETEMTGRWWLVTRKKYKWQIMAFSPWASLGSPGAWCHSLSGEFQIMSVCQSRSLIDWWYDWVFILRCLSKVINYVRLRDNKFIKTVSIINFNNFCLFITLRLLSNYQ